MVAKKIFLTDKEVARVVGCSESTIARICKGQFGKRQRILLAKPQVIGGGRRWSIKALAEALEISEDEISSAIK